LPSRQQHAHIVLFLGTKAILFFDWQNKVSVAWLKDGFRSIQSILETDPSLFND
jgi:hypothetical protein